MSSVTRPGRLLREFEVVEQQRRGGGYLNLIVRAPDLVAASSPGHFAMLRAWPGWDPLLPRPFSFARLDRDSGTCEFLYRVVGRGTGLLARLEGGDRVTVLAPLGEPFPVPDRGRIALVGRGLGIAPLIAVAELAAARGLAVDAYLSAREGANVPGMEALQPICERLFIQSDDRAGGPRLVTAHLEAQLAATRYDVAYTCGSHRLGRDLQRLQAEHRFAAYVSLETHMACGFGACKACVWPMRRGGPAAPRAASHAATTAGGGDVHWVRTCLEGPVFPLERVIYES